MLMKEHWCPQPSTTRIDVWIRSKDKYYKTYTKSVSKVFPTFSLQIK